MNLNIQLIREIIINGLKEDIGSGDVTSNSIIPVNGQTKGIIHAKEAGIIAGLPLLSEIFSVLDPKVNVQLKKEEGSHVQPGEVLAIIEGSARAVLTGERLALNLLQRLSGIATRTRKFVDLVLPYKAKIVDTRKTTPGLRHLEKYAVTVGGGKNHRYGLYDAVLIKDNHIKVAGGITEAVSLARNGNPHTIKVEVEVESLEGLREALSAKADIIMLDNMNFDQMKEAVAIVDGQCILEASGGVNEDTVIDIAATGVDIISIGALTHSVKALDISLDVGEIKVK